MKITLLFLGRNGAGPRYSFCMAKALVKNSNIYCQALISNNVDNIQDWEKLKYHSNFELLTIETYKNKKEFFLRFINIFSYSKISKLITKFNPDWIYIPMGALLNPGIFLFLKGYKKIYTLHDPTQHIGEKSVFLEALRKIEIRNSCRIILLNRFFKNLTINKYRVCENDITIIPHAGFFKSSKPTFHKEFQFKILFIGRIEKYKGIPLLIEAYHKVVQQIPKLKLIIAGKGDITPYKISLNNDLSSNIEIINKWLTDSEIELLIEESDFVVLPYIDASQSGVIPIAFGNGRTVIATNVGALSEQVPKGIGFTVEANSDDILRKIISIYENGIEELNKLNYNAYTYANENLTWDSSANQLINFLKK
ncbi:MAG: hypothetical protein BGO33_04255 [Bacteroidia bacterium 43-41]|nr:MAG: hypothetical protein BGO33_04255 [Bacteroidia bacterium 43-41]